MNQLFQRKPISELMAESGQTLKRVLGAGDLIMLAIGAVIGAGIFSSIGTAAAGEVLPSGEVVRYGAGPALIFSFILLGIVCGLAGLCYAELASMIPQAGSAYAYSYATLGELIAWIIGWDLILEYAVGNIAVAIAWSGYFNSLLSGFGIHLPDYLTHGYRTALLSSDPAVHALLETAPKIAGIPILLNIPAAAIVLAITWLLYIGVKESTRANNAMVVVKLIVLTIFVGLGAMHIDTANYTPFAPNGWRGYSPGRGDRLLRLHRVRCDLHGGRGDEESTAQHADRDSRRTRDLHGHLRHRRDRRDRSGALPAAEGGRSAGARARSRRPADRELVRGLRRGGLALRGAAGVPVRSAENLPGDGARRAAAAVGRARSIPSTGRLT